MGAEQATSTLLDITLASLKRDGGFDPARLRVLFAHARLLQGDARRALAESTAAAGTPSTSSRRWIST